jgi:hypothetical protein
MEKYLSNTIISSLLKDFSLSFYEASKITKSINKLNIPQCIGTINFQFGTGI